jgi:hypothetical protein
MSAGLRIDFICLTNRTASRLAISNKRSSWMANTLKGSEPTHLLLQRPSV